MIAIIEDILIHGRDDGLVHMKIFLFAVLSVRLTVLDVRLADLCVKLAEFGVN